LLLAGVNTQVDELHFVLKHEEALHRLAHYDCVHHHLLVILQHDVKGDGERYGVVCEPACGFQII
jgi:hypothetical protein